MTFHPSEEHIPTPHEPEHVPTEEPTPHGEEPGGGPGGKAEYPTDDMHSTGTGIAGTAGAIREVSQNVGNVSIGPQSFGALNEEFAGTAQQHVQTAQQHVAATAKEVDAAADATHATADSYQATEDNNAKSFNDIANEGGGEPTAPSSTGGGDEPTTASAAAPAPPTGPTAPTTGSPAGGGDDPTTPSGATSAAAQPAPPTDPSGGATAAAPAAPPPPPPPPPSTPHGAGGPPPTPPGGPGGGPPGRPSWRDTIDDPHNFTPDEQAKIHDALHKMAQDPEPGKVAGSGALTPEQRQLLGRVQKLVTIEPDTPMQKAMPQGSANDYLGNVTRTRAVDGYNFDPSQMGGFVARQQDGTNLHTNTDVIQGNRLDYPGTRFNLADPSEPVYVMRFPADDPSRYSTPLGAPYSDEPGMLGQHDPAVQATATDMTGAANAAGIPPDQYHQAVNQWPYSGIGVTADENLGLPEREMTAGPIPDGAQLYSYDQSGNQVLVGEYDESTGRWTDLRPGATP
jgi:hypothetical protein